MRNGCSELNWTWKNINHNSSSNNNIRLGAWSMELLLNGLNSSQLFMLLIKIYDAIMLTTTKYGCFFFISFVCMPFYCCYCSSSGPWLVARGSWLYTRHRCYKFFRQVVAGHILSWFSVSSNSTDGNVYTHIIIMCTSVLPLNVLQLAATT